MSEDVMGRVKLDLPESFSFSTEIPLRVGDINFGGHLGNDAVLSLTHEAREQFLRAHGFSELDVDGAGIIMVDAVVVYQSEGFYGETMVVEVAVGEFSRLGCDVFFKLSDLASGREVARAKTGIAFYDYDRRKVVRMPAAFRDLF